MSNDAPGSSSWWTCLTCTFAGNPSLYLACSLCNEPRRGQQQHHHHHHLYHDESNNTSTNSKNGNKNTIIASNSTKKPSISNSSSSTTGRSKAPKLDYQQKTAAVPPAVIVVPVVPVPVPTPVPSPRVVGDDISRRPPSHSASINNLSDRQYCCVWNVEVFSDGYRPDVARAMLARIARTYCTDVIHHHHNNKRNLPFFFSFKNINIYNP